MIKRLIDFSISFILIILFAPILIFISMTIYCVDGKPIFFKQLRAGKHGAPFFLLKYRTMSNNLSNLNHLSSDTARVTRLGKFLRATSLDELPNLWNVLIGEISLIGPRPLPVSYLPLYNKKQARRHEVKPGITGLAQISGRNILSWNDRFNLDVYYVENVSLMLDIKILLMTFKVVMLRQGVNASKNISMEIFKGNGKG